MDPLEIEEMPTRKSKSYSCQHCSEVCSSNFNLDRHVARRHPDRLTEIMRKKRTASDVPLSFVLPQSIGAIHNSANEKDEFEGKKAQSSFIIFCF